MDQSLFDSFNARFLQPSQIAERFVIPSQFQLICERNHSVVIGPRGSGKTTLLKMLHIAALKKWRLSHHSKVVDNIDFTAVYVAADSSWSAAFGESQEYDLSEESRDLIATAIFMVYLQFAFVDTLEELANEDLTKDNLLARFHIPLAHESEIAAALASTWQISGNTPSYFILRSKLSQRLNEIARLADALKFGLVSSVKIAVGANPFLSLRYEFTLKNTIDAINSLIGQPHRKWCLCIDELEIVPEKLRLMLFRNLRSSDQRILFKISLSPFSIDLLGHEPNNPMPGQDYIEVYLSYSRSSDAVRFGKELLASLLDEAGLPDTPPEEIFGHSAVATVESSQRVPPGSYAAPDGERYKLIADLEARDPSFRTYLKGHRYDISNMPKMPERKRAEIRKLLQICRARLEFRQFGENRGSQIDDKPGYRRSRKRIHVMYTGMEALLTICEGNPRWIIGILRPQLLEAKVRQEDGSSTFLDPAYQARQILKVITRYRALLGTIPLHRGKNQRSSVLELIDAIGNYMFRDVVLGSFKPEPALSFIVDRGVSPSQVEALGTAINQGAFVVVPSRKGDTTFGTIEHSRFRLSYLLAPDFQLPLTYGAPINLSTILKVSTGPAQIRLSL